MGQPAGYHLHFKEEGTAASLTLHSWETGNPRVSADSSHGLQDFRAAGES